MIRKQLLSLSLIILSISVNSQRNDILTNDYLIVELIKDFIKEGETRDLNLKYRLTNKVDYIMIAPDSIKINNLGTSNKDTRAILLSNKVRIDKTILKVILFRELSYMLGVPYGGNVIMSKEKPKWFSYSILSNPEIMNIEMNPIMSEIAALHSSW